MPVVNKTPTAPPDVTPAVPVIHAPEYQGVTVDTRFNPLSSLMTHIEGASMTVNYYKAILGNNSPLTGQNINLIPEFQQYRLIKGFEFKVTNPFTTSQDTTTNAMLTTGSANIYSFLKPNVGDMFITDIGDGREGIFKITNVERKTMYKETTHVVEYQMIIHTSNRNQWLSDLNSKVVETLVFVSDYLQYGQNPFLQEEDYDIAMKLEAAFEEITKIYFREFLSNEFMTLCVPGQEQPTYDHFLTKAATSYFTTFDAPELRKIRKLNCDGDELMKAVQFWDVLAEKNPNLLNICAQKAGLVSAKQFHKNPMTEGVYHSGIIRLVYLKDPELPLDYLYRNSPKVLMDETLKQVPVRERAAAAMPDVIPPLLHNVTIDDYYVLSKAFYDKAEEGQSKLELAVHDYLDEKAPNNKVLLTLAQTYHAWGALERYYYGPILLVLIRSSLRSA